MKTRNANKQKDLSDLSKRIREARKLAHLSQRALGQFIGVSDKSISSYEKGRSIPPVNKLKKIAQNTRRPLAFFTEEEVNQSTILHKLSLVEEELAEIRKLLQSSSK